MPLGLLLVLHALLTALLMLLTVSGLALLGGLLCGLLVLRALLCGLLVLRGRLALLTGLLGRLLMPLGGLALLTGLLCGLLMLTGLLGRLLMLTWLLSGLLALLGRLLSPLLTAELLRALLLVALRSALDEPPGLGIAGLLAGPLAPLLADLLGATPVRCALVSAAFLLTGGAGLPTGRLVTARSIALLLLGLRALLSASTEVLVAVGHRWVDNALPVCSAPGADRGSLRDLSAGSPHWGECLCLAFAVRSTANKRGGALAVTGRRPASIQRAGRCPSLSHERTARAHGNSVLRTRAPGRKRVAER
ncbi:hypothetical protein [Halomicrobium salinisoli]|uniref:hypothetical protein n=1 Tax=Halomicrobium salinisoli TaxID=2878391 RepID=UPI001CF042E2|nr:hypothetical protein [Halomicrobium salinisoli]